MEIKAVSDGRPRINIIDVLKPADEIEDEQTYGQHHFVEKGF